MNVLCRAAGQGKSVAQTARDLLTEKLRPSKAEVWAEADRLRKKIAKVSSNSPPIFANGAIMQIRTDDGH
jgi:plasmid stability protein